MTVILDLPENVLSTVFSFLKHEQNLGSLRLVCRHFNDFASESMFDTIVVHGSSSEPKNDPVEWLTSPEEPHITTDDCSRLTHQLDTLHNQRLPVPHRRAKRLKIFVSEFFKLNNREPGVTSGSSSVGQRDIQSVVQCLVLTLPAIIRTLGNLRDTTLYISSHDPDDFIYDISEALLVLPHMISLNVNFLNQKAVRALPIVNSSRLESIKISWPTGEPDPLASPSTPLVDAEKTSIYRVVMNTGSNLRRLELSAKRRLHADFRTYLEFTGLEQLEELVLENVPLTLGGDVAAGMTNLHSLRLAGYNCLNCDPYAGVFTSLKTAGRRLRVVGVDVVGQAMVNYLESYENLEALVLKLDKDANDYCVKELCQRGLRYHGQSLKLLHFDLDPFSDSRLTWFFEYWTEWIPDLQNLRILKVTTSMNLFFTFDAGVLIKGVLDIVARMPTLQKVTIRHLHEKDPEVAESVFKNQATGFPSQALSKPVRITPSCLVVLPSLQKLYRVVLERGEGLYGSLRIIPCGE